LPTGAPAPAASISTSWADPIYPRHFSKDSTALRLDPHYIDTHLKGVVASAESDTRMGLTSP
jgi:hypothetical protein